MSNNVLSALNEHLRATGEPVATTTDLVDRVEVVRRTVLSKLELLEQRGDVASKDVGRGRVWWPVDDDRPADPPADPPEESGDGVHYRSLNGGESPPEDPPEDPPAEPLADLDDVDDILEELVDEGASEWDRDTDNYQERREAALAGLQWLREDGGPASASDFQKALWDAHSVSGQSQDTWWRKSVRPALAAAVDRELASYQHGLHEYTWTG